MNCRVRVCFPEHRAPTHRHPFDLLSTTLYSAGHLLETQRTAQCARYNFAFKLDPGDYTIYAVDELSGLDAAYDVSVLPPAEKY